MVLYKRRPVKLLPEPKGLDDNTEIWVLEETGEVFLEYDDYLRRRDYYLQPSFTCETTGCSNLTYFEAKESETEAVKEINGVFPKPLTKPVLCFVQFRTESRMDDLVNAVHDHFKEEYFQDEVVTVEDGNNARRRGIITGFTDANHMHTTYHGQMLTNSGYAGYIITMDDNKETIVKHRASELQRDRKTYSKLILKQFLRATIKREAWIGAPWTVRPTLAKSYDISTKVPDHKTQAAIAAQRQALINSANGATSPQHHHTVQHIPNGHLPYQNGHHVHPSPSGQAQPGFHNFVANGLQAYAQQHQPHIQFSGPPPYLQHQGVNVHPTWNNGQPFQMHGPLPYQINHQPPHFTLQPPQLNHQQPPSGANLPAHLVHVIAGSALPLNLPFQTSFPHNPPQPNHRATGPQSAQQPSQAARPLVQTIKYPCEDLEIKDVSDKVRPTLKFFSDDGPDGYRRADDMKTGILMKSVGPLLGAWETLNVHDTIYMLDSFTFDDFVDAMIFQSDETECELFVEIHCSVLKQIVDESGKIQPPLPRMAETDDSENGDSSQESSPTPEHEPEPEPPARTTRSSLRKSEAQQLVARPQTPTPEPSKDLHITAEFIADFDWVEHCRVRNFRNGNWQAIVVALLYRLSFDPAQKEACNEILAQLVPADEEATVESIATNYANLDVNLRVSALDMILRLTIVTEAFRDQLVAAAQEMTCLRKEKFDFQRKRKELADDLYKLDLDRKILLPANTPASPSAAKDNDALDVSMTSVADESTVDMDRKKEDADEDNGPPTNKGKTRPVNKNKRKAAAEEARKEKAKKSKAAAEQSKKQREWEKLLTDIQKKKDGLAECEANILELDDDLRETLVHRSKVLGKDRFLNKYYWFEHNGMPFGGVPNSSTAEYGYANGRIWVQGPDKYELQPNLEEPALSQDQQRFGITVPERKEKEEGETHLSSSSEWGCYDDPKDINDLIAWLEERGQREKHLKKELLLFKDDILTYMNKMRSHISARKEKTVDGDEASETEEKPRVSTRNKSSLAAGKDTNKQRCLVWTNSMMRDEYGHVHHDEYEPPRKAKSKAKAPAKANAKSRGRR